MNIKDKVQDLVKYCSSYQGHTNMMDERRKEQAFQVLLPEERLIQNNMDQLQFILLTGEAGDGKSRLLRILNQDLLDRGFDIYPDFSAMPEGDKQYVLHVISDIIDEISDARIIIAANIGVFTKSILQYQPNILEKLNEKNSRIKIINFEKRNLAQDEEIFKQIVRGFLEYDGEECPECILCGRCIYKDNLEYLRSPKGIESLRVLCDTVYLIGEHITFRELLSLIAYMVTFGEPCNYQRNTRSVLPKPNSYEYIFDKNEDRVLQHISRMDPACKRSIEIPYESIEQCIEKKREHFFQTRDDRYALLNIDYLSEFREVLQYFQENAFVDAGTIQDGVLYSLKRGLGRLTRKGQSDLGMTVADTPTMLGNEIQTEFELGSMDIVWHRYGLDFNNLENNDLKDDSYNRFSVSYIYNDVDGKVKSITMIINYRLFRYLMMADNCYYLGHSNQSVEEYTINTFFRKILKTHKGVYGKMLVKFTDQKRDELCNFSLSLQERNRILFPGEKVIKLKKEG